MFQLGFLPVRERSAPIYMTERESTAVFPIFFLMVSIMTTLLRMVVLTLVPPLFGIASLQTTESNVAQTITGQHASGLITGLAGAPLAGTIGDATRNLSLGNTVATDEELNTDQHGILEILWDRHALIFIQPQSKVLIHESKAGQTEVSLRGGSVRVALAYNSGRTSDVVTVQTPSSRVFTRGGILEVDVLPPSPSVFSRIASVFSPPEAPAASMMLETVRVVEGEAGIEPVTAPGLSQMLEAGHQAQIAAGKVERSAELARDSFKGAGLANTDRRQGTPSPLTQRLVNVHITHALEVERQMSAQSPAVDQAGVPTGSDLKGTVIATSVVVPNVTLGQPGTTRGPAPTPQLPPTAPSAPAPPPIVITPLPPPSGPVTSGPPPTVTTPLPPPVTSPLPTLPQIPTLVSGQSGGLNSRKLLRQFFDDDDDDNGRRNRNRGRDRDRDDDQDNDDRDNRGRDADRNDDDGDRGDFDVAD